MLTRSACVARPLTLLPAGQGVTTLRHMITCGWTRAAIRANLDADRWQMIGRAVVLHNGPIHPDEFPTIALLNCGPRAALTAFTLAQLRGLRGWEREAIDVLVPGGARIMRQPGVPLRVHWSSEWAAEDVRADRHALAPALVLAAASFDSPRPACGILAAGVQQQLVSADELARAVRSRPRVRHRAALGLAVADIAQGAEALSEIDFVTLCRRNRLPAPRLQAVRTDRFGRRRYVDAEWRSRTGKRVVAEVDGALHLAPRRWWNDQLRQNELAITGDLVLRFPTVVFRHESATVVDQLRRALDL
jgi:very-short-patch-repair endonuclease